MLIVSRYKLSELTANLQQSLAATTNS